MLLSKFSGENSKWRKPISIAILIILVWLFLWYFPWQDKLHHIYWLQLGVGLAIFIMPGLCIYGLLSGHSNLEFNHLTFGFAISHLLFAILGAAGRLFHLSFESISFLMMASGLVLLLLYIMPLINRGKKFHIDREKFAPLLPLLAILLISLLAGVIVIQRILSDDDLTYLAYTTNMQYSAHLKFNYPILDESQLASSRFWLMSAPLAQALLAKISETPGILLLGGYYEPFLVLFSVLSWYELAIALKLSPRAASASVILQLSFLLLLSEYLHPGSPYFFQLSTDKSTAAFILAPVFFQSLIKLLENPTRNNMLLSLLTGLSLTFMHPIILAYAVFIGGMFVLLNKNDHGFRNKIIPIIILAIILGPQIAIRFVKIPGIGPISFDAEVILNQDGSDNLITSWKNTNFYGFNLNILSMKFPYEANIPLPESILKWGWLLIPSLAVVFAIGQREKSVAQYILSCSLLCFLAGFPFTGWFIGYFLNGRMLARSVWLFPYGLSFVYIFIAFRDYISGKVLLQKYKIGNISISPNWFLPIVTVLAVILFSSYINENDLQDLEKFSTKSQRYQGLAIAGQELDRRIVDYAHVIGSEQLNDLIPGISAKSKPIIFRILNPSHMPYFSKAEVDERISDTKKIFSKSLSPEEKMLLLEKYNVQFLFLQSFDLRLFEDFIARYPDRVEKIETGGVVILQIKEQGGG